MNVKAQIEEILKREFNPAKLIVRDDSARHAGHAGAQESGGGHFTLEIASAAFNGLPPVKRHRLIYAALKPLQPQIHALALKISEV